MSKVSTRYLVPRAYKIFVIGCITACRSSIGVPSDVPTKPSACHTRNSSKNIYSISFYRGVLFLIKMLKSILWAALATWNSPTWASHLLWWPPRTLKLLRSSGGNVSDVLAPFLVLPKWQDTEYPWSCWSKQSAGSQKSRIRGGHCVSSTKEALRP